MPDLVVTAFCVSVPDTEHYVRTYPPGPTAPFLNPVSLYKNTAGPHCPLLSFLLRTSCHQALRPQRMSLLNTLLSATNFQNPFLRNLVPSIGLAYGIQAAAAVPSIIAGTERFYDLSGSVTYISCAALSLFLPAIRARSAAAAVGATKPAWPSILAALKGQGAGPGMPLGLNWRQVALSAAVSVWAGRRT